MTADTLPAPVATTPELRRPRRWRLWLAVAVAVLLVGLTGRVVLANRAADVRSGTEAVNAQEFAARTGVKVNLLGLTAGGGMIEFRYQVVDPDKASLLLHEADKRPVLVAEDTGSTLAMVSRPHIHRADLKLGGTYFFLLANAHNAIKDGTPITVVIGDVRLEHVKAQS